MLAESFASILGHTGLKLLAQTVVVEIAADDHQLVLARSRPVAVINGEAFARKVKHMSPLAFVEPEDPLGTEHRGGELIVEEILKFA